MKSIEALKKRLSAENTLLIQDEHGCVKTVEFKWENSATDTEISQFENDNKIILPEDYKKFLKISNGTTLFMDTWGYQIYGLSEIMEETEKAKWPDFKDTWLVFGRHQSDGDLYIFDLEKVKNNEKVYLLYGMECDHPSDYFYLGSFGTWLDRLIVSQGSQYWLWFPNH